MKSLLRSSLSSVFYHGAQMFGSKQSNARILCYHRVNNETVDYITVPTEVFREQLEFLSSEGYQTVGLNDLLQGNTDEKSIVITFDDGYEDNYANAFPILNHFGFTATIFCIAEKVNAPGYLNLNQISEMSKKGFIFGSHTISHPRLPNLTQEEKRREITDSKKILEEKLGIPVFFFCYPYGEFDEETVELVSEAGYHAACSNIPGGNEKITPFLLRRTEIAASDSLYDFRKKLAGAYDFLHQGLHWFRKRP